MGENGGTDGDCGTELSAIFISKLCWKAHENALNVDRSREMLIAALKEVPEEDEEEDSDEDEEEED